MSERKFEQAMEHLRNALAKVLVEEVEFPRGVFVTVLETKMTRDQTHAKAVLSVLPNTMEKEALEALGEYDHEIKDGLAKELRLRHIPRLHWSFDETEAVAAGVDQALLELKRKGEL